MACRGFVSLSIIRLKQKINPNRSFYVMSSIWKCIIAGL